MLTGNEFFVVVRLTTGEQILCALTAEDDNYVEILHPMIVRSIQNFETGKEHITVAPFCVYSQERNFIFDKKNVVFIKKLSQTFVPHYINTVREHEENKFVPRDSKKEDEFEHLRGVADAMSAIEQLRPIADETETEKSRVFVEGNDTVH
jgi:hypothetical protein